jgi:hypothetical protein
MGALATRATIDRLVGLEVQPNIILEMLLRK